MAQMHIDTPVGQLAIDEMDGTITRVRWRATERPSETPLLREACRQVSAYFAGDLTDFDLPLAPAVSEFEKGVLDAMLRIPFGETRTYGDLARELDAQPQAIGQACGANPIPLIIPCHRILAANGLGGYSGDGGIETKITLLRHERAGGLLL